METRLQFSMESQSRFSPSALGGSGHIHRVNSTCTSQGGAEDTNSAPAGFSDAKTTVDLKAVCFKPWMTDDALNSGSWNSTVNSRCVGHEKMRP